MTPSIVNLPWLREPSEDFVSRCRAVSLDTNAGATIQCLANHRLSTRQYVNLDRVIRHCQSCGVDLSPLSEFRLGLLASATYDLLIDSLAVASARHGVSLDIFATAYDQVMQQALDPVSELNSTSLDAVLVAVDYRWINLDRPILEGKPEDAISAAILKLRNVVEGLRENGNSPAILQTLAVPPAFLFGSLDRKISGTIRSMIGEVNNLVVALANETGSYLLDVAALAEQVGTDRWFDHGQWLSYKLPFSADCFPIYCDLLGRLLGSIRGKARKCLVLDLDNTIWGGVIGDDGVEGVLIGQGTARGEAFLSVQQAALDLRSRGILLAVCSKNDDAVARLPFREHTGMLLRESDISVFQANWLDKASNLEAIASKLNIGLESLVLLDDNPAERLQVSAALPMVGVPELPEDPSYYAWYLNSAGYFEAVTYSEDDRFRSESYSANPQRAEIRKTARDLGEYLTALEMTISFSPFNMRGRQRTTQLINKTNQFNLTTRRYTEHEVAEMEIDTSMLTLQVSLKDKFGDLGMIAVVVLRSDNEISGAWVIDTWLMSCRVLGRRVEHAILKEIIRESKKHGVCKLIGMYIPSAKNGLVEEHYTNVGFQYISTSESLSTMWELDLRNYVPQFIPMQIVRS